MRIEAKLEELGLVLPEPMRVAPGLRLPFDAVCRLPRISPLLGTWVNNDNRYSRLRYAVRG